MKGKNTGLRIQPERLAKLDSMAAAVGVTRNALISMIIDVADTEHHTMQRAASEGVSRFFVGNLEPEVIHAISR
ncbi:MAG: hypothetical protein IT348_20370 [Candidatus Eisenbacteria bacterium]|nr:hypothetical protein [Candidatus Eisenbacteria bacterium]